MGLLDEISVDAACYARARWPNRQGGLTWLSCMVLLATCRGLQLLVFHRFQHWVYKRYGQKTTIGAYFFKVLCYCGNHLAVIMAKSQVECDVVIGLGTYLSNAGNMIIGAVRIGAGCVVQANVTIGVDNTSPERKKPSIGSSVWIGANSVIYGGISIGDGVTLQEGTVLSRSVPARCVVGGNPVRILRRDWNNEGLLANPNGCSAELM